MFKNRANKALEKKGKERSGGRLFPESSALQRGFMVEAFHASLLRTARASQAKRARRITLIRGLCAVIGLAAGILSAIYAYQRTSSWPLGIFVFLVTLLTIGGGVSNILTERDKVRRAVYYALTPAVATGVLYLAFRWWDRWWLAVLLGLTAWVLFGGFISTIVFRESSERRGSETGP